MGLDRLDHHTVMEKDGGGLACHLCCAIAIFTHLWHQILEVLAYNVEVAFDEVLPCMQICVPVVSVWPYIYIYIYIYISGYRKKKYHIHGSSTNNILYKKCVAVNVMGHSLL